MWYRTLTGGLLLALAAGGAGLAGEETGNDVPVAGRSASEYWLGLLCTPVEPALRAQLALPDDRGLVVLRVMPESPAAKGGVREHDVLLTAGDKPLRTLANLVGAVDAAGDSQLRLELIRAGKAQSIEVRPDRRPAPGEEPAGQEDADWKALRGWMENFVPGGPPVRFQFYRPGTILPPGGSALPALPDDLSITVTRRGHEPAQVVVQRGDQRWEVSEKDLGKLPEDVRPYVERMLEPWGWSTRVAVPAERPDRSSVERQGAELQGRLQKQFDRMNEQLEQLRRQMEELRPGGAPHSAAPEAKK